MCFMIEFSTWTKEAYALSCLTNLNCSHCSAARIAVTYGFFLLNLCGY